MFWRRGRGKWVISPACAAALRGPRVREAILHYWWHCQVRDRLTSQPPQKDHNNSTSAPGFICVTGSGPQQQTLCYWGRVFKHCIQSGLVCLWSHQCKTTSAPLWPPNRSSALPERKKPQFRIFAPATASFLALVIKHHAWLAKQSSDWQDNSLSQNQMCKLVFYQFIHPSAGPAVKMVLKR